MSQPCTNTTCKRPSRAVCGCCKQHFCLPHLKEHNDALVTQLNPLSDEINALGGRLAAVNVTQITSDSRQKLEQWRIDCHKTIDRLFEKKCQELDGLVTKKMDKQRDEIDRLRSKVVKLIDEQEATQQDIEQLTSHIENLKREMKKIERTSVQANVRPLVIDNILIHVEEQVDLITLPSSSKTIKCPAGGSVELTGNDRFLLIHQTPNLCLINREWATAKQTVWNHGDIYDMCWSSALERFILLTVNDIYLVNENTMSIEHVKVIPREKWFCCTCSENSLFLSTNVWGPSMMEFSLLPSIQLINQWQSPRTCLRDEIIDSLVYDDRKLAVTVKNHSKKTVHIELRSSSTLDRLWSLLLDTIYNESIRITCCVFKHGEWLLLDRHASRVLYITRDGEVQTACAYNPAPFRAHLFGTNTLAISIEKGVNFHQV